MKNIKFLLILIASAIAFTSCNDTETYSDQKKKERSAINSWIAKQKVKVISEKEFINNNYKTDLSQNEFVLFNNTGVYMQIIREGCGEKLKDGETTTVLCRFSERNLLTDTIQLSNEVLDFSSAVDKMTVKNTSGTFTASFIAGSSVMYSIYQTASVPAGWLVPLSYINVGRPANQGDEIAKVRIIVPHTQGHSFASSGVYPCLYDITYQRGR